MAHSEISLATAARAGATSPLLTTSGTTGGAARGETNTPNTSGEAEGRHPRRRRSFGGGSGGVGGGSGSGGRSGGGGSGGGGAVTPRSRGRGFRDVEGEAIAVAAKMSEVVTKKDLLEALRVLRLVQVNPKWLLACRNRFRQTDLSYLPVVHVVLCGVVFLFGVLACVPQPTKEQLTSSARRKVANLMFGEHRRGSFV